MTEKKQWPARLLGIGLGIFVEKLAISSFLQARYEKSPLKKKRILLLNQREERILNSMSANQNQNGSKCKTRHDGANVPTNLHDVNAQQLDLCSRFFPYDSSRPLFSTGSIHNSKLSADDIVVPTSSRQSSTVSDI